MSSPRRWGRNVVIDGSWYETPAGKKARKPRMADYRSNPVGSYEAAVQDLLRNIQTRSRVGRILIGRINAQPRRLYIVPLAYGDNLRTRTTRVRQRRFFKTRSDVVLHFEPFSWIRLDRLLRIDPKGVVEADDVLVHEMVHALREMRGISTMEPMREGYETLEDFYAVMITNIYLSDVGRTNALRGSHRGSWQPLAGKPLTGSSAGSGHVDFYLRYKREIDRLYRTMPDLCRPLANTTAPIAGWNPVRQAGRAR